MLNQNVRLMTIQRALLNPLALMAFLTTASAADRGDPSVRQRDAEVVLKSGAAMTFRRDVAITSRDGHVVYASIYRPKEEGRYPVILAQTVHGKDPNFRDAYKTRFEELLKNEIPGLCEKSSCNFIKWEVTDPERWIPEKYAMIVVDVRGSGKSPGLLDTLSPRETADYYDAIEWAGVQPRSNGKVGLLGTSYLAMNQWQVAALQPPHWRRSCLGKGRLTGTVRSPITAGFSAISSRASGRAIRSPQMRTATAGRPIAIRTRQTRRLERLLRSIFSALTSPQELGVRLKTRLTSRSHRSCHASRFRCCPQEIGAAWGCTDVAISKAICKLIPRINGWRCIPAHTTGNFTAMLAWRCRKNSSITI